VQEEGSDAASEFDMLHCMLRPEEVEFTPGKPPLIGVYTLTMGPRTEAQEKAKVRPERAGWRCCNKLIDGGFSRGLLRSVTHASAVGRRSCPLVDSNVFTRAGLAGAGQGHSERHAAQVVPRGSTNSVHWNMSWCL
jgi:hypothetical protein